MHHHHLLRGTAGAVLAVEALQRTLPFGPSAVRRSPTTDVAPSGPSSTTTAGTIPDPAVAMMLVVASLTAAAPTAATAAAAAAAAAGAAAAATPACRLLVSGVAGPPFETAAAALLPAVRRVAVVRRSPIAVASIAAAATTGPAVVVVGWWRRRRQGRRLFAVAPSRRGAPRPYAGLLARCLAPTVRVGVVVVPVTVRTPLRRRAARLPRTAVCVAPATGEVGLREVEEERQGQRPRLRHSNGICSTRTQGQLRASTDLESALSHSKDSLTPHAERPTHALPTLRRPQTARYSSNIATHNFGRNRHPRSPPTTN